MDRINSMNQINGMSGLIRFIRRWSPLARTVLSLLLVGLAGWVGWGAFSTPHLASGAAIKNAAPLATTAPASSTTALHLPPGPLPGSEIWNEGASSFLFGSNDAYEWSDKNIETMPAIQQALKDAGLTLLRTFIPDNADDATLEQRIQTVEHSGAVCLAVLTNVTNVSFNKHVVSYFGNRCNLYEFGNEPDYFLVPIKTYMAAWNSTTHFGNFPFPSMARLTSQKSVWRCSRPSELTSTCCFSVRGSVHKALLLAGRTSLPRPRWSRLGVKMSSVLCAVCGSG